jgi:hypothetical protein
MDHDILCEVLVERGHTKKRIREEGPGFPCDASFMKKLEGKRYPCF